MTIIRELWSNYRTEVFFFLGLSAFAFVSHWLLFFFFTYSTEQILFRTDPWSNVQTDNASGAKEEKEPREETDDTVQTDSVQILEEWIESEKPYLRTDFQLMDLRAVLPMNRTYLSQLINNTYGFQDKRRKHNTPSKEHGDGVRRG